MPRKILYEKRSDGVAHVLISRADSLNALDSEAKEQLAEAWTRSAADPDVRAVILSGAGPRAFCAGSDMKEVAATGHTVATDLLSRALPGVAAPFDKPIVAAIHGFCMGLGLNLACHCDIRIANQHSVFGFPEVRHGMITGMGAVRVPRMIPRGSALYLLLSGDTIDAQEALRVGLVDRVTAGDALEEGSALAARIASYPAVAVQATKRLASSVLDAEVRDRIDAIDRERTRIDIARLKS